MTRRLPRFLADESCDFAVVRTLRESGYDVFAISEATSRSNDREVIDKSHSENRVLVDKDFGHLVFVSNVDSAGVILIRFPGSARGTLAPAVRDLIETQGENLIGAFAVIQPGYIRISRRKSRR